MYYFGALPPKKDIQAYKAVGLKAASALDLPEEFELTMPGVKNQGQVGSCVAHAVSTTVEYFNRVQEGTNTVFSTGFIYGNRQNTTHKGSGMYVDKALHNLRNIGDVANTLFPYNIEVPEAITKYEERAEELKPKAYPNRITEYFQINNDEQRKVNLMNNGPIVFSIPWYSDYMLDKDNVMRHESDEIRGYHAMVIYGWNKDGWKIQNSWGKGFGNGGRAILPFDTKFSTCYGIRDDVSGEDDNLDIDKPFKNLPKWIVSLINFIINLFAKKK